MYAEQFGVSSRLEEPAMYVQWASYGMGQGISDATVEGSIRASLDKFWKSKASLYGSVTTAERGQLDKLDSLAHGIWGALEEGLALVRSGDIFGATRKVQEKAAAARAAYDQAAALAKSAQAQGTRTAAPVVYSTLQRGVSATEAEGMDLASGRFGFLSKLGESYFGVPLYGWLALGAVAVFVVIKGKR